VLPGKTTTEDSPKEKCTLLFVLHAANKHKSRLSQAAINPFIAAIVFPKKEDNHLNRIIPAIYPLVTSGGFTLCNLNTQYNLKLRSHITGDII